MKKVLIFLLVVGVLMLGTFAMAEEISESYDLGEFSEGDLGDTTNGGTTPCGGGDGAGPGGAPG